MPRHGPEWHIQQDLIEFLTIRTWNVEHTHGNSFQTGFPDLFIAHRSHGTRWIDVKNPKRYRFTDAQCRKWPVWEAFGIGIWILVAATQSEYDKLFGPPNWRDYWKPQWAVADVDAIIAQLLSEEADAVDVPRNSLCDGRRGAGR